MSHRRLLALVLLLLIGTGARAQDTVLYEFMGHGSGDEFGFSVDGAGDVNDDGVPDFLIGADRADAGFTNSGTATVYSGADGSVLYSWDGSSADARMGHAVAGAGDVNSDGFDDVILVAIYQIFPNTPGQVSVRSGKDGSLLHQWAPAGSVLFGQAVTGTGDVNGDGYDDVAVSDPYDSVSAFQAGSVYVYSGQTGALIRSHHGVAANQLLGEGLAGGKDVDGDLIPDLVVGSPFFNGGQVQVFSGATGGELHLLTGAGQFGRHVDLSEDMNGDGCAEILIGDVDGLGHCWVLSGKDGSVLHALTGGGSDHFGWAVAAVGDATGDGVPDVAVGAYADGENGSAAGATYLFDGADGAELYKLNGTATGHYLGWTVAGTGDVDGDGLGDLLIGATPPYHSTTLPGSARVVSGSCKALAATYGTGHAGSGGFVPSLTFEGCPARSASFQITIDQTLAGTPGLLLMGFSQASLPLAGGTLLVLPPFLNIPLFFQGSGAGAGSLTLATVIPDEPGVVGVSLYLQAFVFDAGASNGLAMTNGLCMTIR